MFLIKFIFGVIIAISYYILMNFLSRIINSEYYYARPIATKILSLFSCFLILVLSITVSRKNIRIFFSYGKFAIIVTIALIIAIVIPICVAKSGIVADETSLKKINMFGNIKKEYFYENITSIDLSVKYGLQYEIEFDSKETVILLGYEGGHNFNSDESLVEFDKIVSSKCNKHVTQESVWLKPWNTKRFFRTQQGFEYFDRIFSAYY